MKKNALFLLLLLLFCFSNSPAQNEKKAAYGVLLDNTGSLRNQFDRVKSIGKEIIREISENDSIALFNFETSAGKNETSEVKLGIGWSRDEKVFQEYIDKLNVVGGRTTLNDSIFLVAGVVNSKVEREKPARAEKILILVTDGEERASKTDEKEIINLLKENNIKVYVVGLTDELDEKRGFTYLNSKYKAERFLKYLASETGGRAVFPKSKEKPKNIVKELFTENITQTK